MNSESTPSVNLLACMICGEIQEFELSTVNQGELYEKQELRLFCRVCRQVTPWNAVQKDRRSGQDRRGAPQSRITLPIRIRCGGPGLEFVEVTHTLTASRRGASFVSRHALREGVALRVSIPYSEGDPEIYEKQARVVWTEKKDGNQEVGIEFGPSSRDRGA